jgi:tetratricopeptide (TPR) repeat protein
MKPNDADLLLAEADVLIQLKRPGEAIGVYRNAQRAGAHEGLVKQKIVAAQFQRQALVRTCLTQAGDVGIRACESAWLPGAPDEVVMFKRRGLLLQDGSPAAALDAYMSAARLAPRDREAARAVVHLSAGLGAKGAAILTARGAALMTLDRAKGANEAVGAGNGASPDAPAPSTETRLPAESNKSYSNDAPVTRSQ